MACRYRIREGGRGKEAMISIFGRFAPFFVVLAVTGVQARAVEVTTAAALMSSQTEGEQACLTRVVWQVADEMDQDNPGSGRKVRDLFTRVFAHHTQPPGEEDFYRELRFIERTWPRMEKPTCRTSRSNGSSGTWCGRSFPRTGCIEKGFGTIGEQSVQVARRERPVRAVPCRTPSFKYSLT